MWFYYLFRVTFILIALIVKETQKLMCLNWPLRMRSSGLVLVFK